MADDQDIKPPRAIFPEGRGRRYMVSWPTPTAPRYVLAWGELGPPPQLRSWGVATFEGDGGSDHIWGDRPKDVSSNELRAWLLTKNVDPEAVRAMVASAIDSRPDLFAGGVSAPL
jgi:hypothetical protein